MDPLISRRRSHLPSQTYHSLVRICSIFNGNSRVSLGTPTVIQELPLRSDNNSKNEAAQASSKEIYEPGEIHPADDTQPENSSLPSHEESAAQQCCNDMGSGEAGIISCVTESKTTGKMDTTFQEDSLMLGNNSDAFNFQDGLDGQSLMSMEDFELILDEDHGLLPEDYMNIIETLDGNDGDINMIASLEDNSEKPLEPTQIVVEKPNIATEPQEDPIEGSKIISDTISLSTEKGVAEEILKSEDCKEGRSCRDSEGCNKTQFIDMGLEDLVSSGHDLVTSAAQMVEDNDIEEGEITGELYINHEEIPLGNDVSVEGMDGKQVTKANRDNSSSNPFCAVESFCGIVGENNADESHETACGEEKKKARSKRFSGNKKARFRKKRAEARRALGVNKLRLKPVVEKPKPVIDCRHYLLGRCHMGESCKFSHDGVPVTKSSPCTYFATQSCMKGDDCPFDHDLSKYPCNNFTTKGYCKRGDLCMFSHKGPSQSVSPTPTATATAIGTSANDAAAASFSFGVLPRAQTSYQHIKPQTAVPERVSNPLSFLKPSRQTYQGSSTLKINEHEKTLTPARKLSVAPKGVSFLSADKTSSEKSATTSLLDQGTSYFIENLLKIGSHTSNQRNSSERPQPSPAAPVTPKGISFLSIGSNRESKTQDAPRTPSSQQHASECIKTRPNTSTQKTLISALKLAAEFDSGKKKRSIDAPTDVNKPSSDNTSVTASSGSSSSKILEFMSSFMASDHKKN